MDEMAQAVLVEEGRWGGGGFRDDGEGFRGGGGDRIHGFSRGEGYSEATEIVKVFWSFGGS